MQMEAVDAFLGKASGLMWLLRRCVLLLFTVRPPTARLSTTTVTVTALEQPQQPTTTNMYTYARDNEEANKQSVNRG